MSTVALDSWAVLALLNDEPAADRVELVIDRGETLMSWINLGEVYYQTLRRRDEGRARTAIDAIQRRVRVEEPDPELILAPLDSRQRAASLTRTRFALRPLSDIERPSIQAIRRSFD